MPAVVADATGCAAKDSLCKRSTRPRERVEAEPEAARSRLLPAGDRTGMRGSGFSLTKSLQAIQKVILPPFAVRHWREK